MVQPISVRQVRLRDSFWSPYQELVTDTVIPYQEQILKDAVPQAEKSHALANFRIAAGLEQGEFYGMVFQDSDVAKWLEAAAFSLWVRPDPELERRAGEVIDVIARAQQPNGYLDTYFIIKEPEHRWQDLLEGHELYCMGHMMEAAAAWYEVTGKDDLLRVAERMADHIGSVFGENRYGIPGHEEVEVGLLRLYQATQKEEYLRLAMLFLDRRGQRPDFFRREQEKRDFTIGGLDPDYLAYNQSHASVREQASAEGHAVRAVYLYRAMADAAAITGDKGLRRACQRLMDSIRNRKMYLTGGIGASGEWESFSKDYDLPGDRAYAETCAQVGLVFFAKSMLDLTPDGAYADVMERCLYNSTISGMQLDGKHFFYVNPLSVDPGLSGEVFGMRHVLPERPGWYQCACCPPNLARMILSLGKLCWSEKEDTVFTHLFIGQTAQLGLADITVESGYPWEGTVKLTVTPKDRPVFRLALHIPGYLDQNEFSVLCNGGAVCGSISKGYLYIERNWMPGDTVEISFPLKPRRVYGTVRCLDTAGKTALARGPIVYCLEGVDNGPQLQALSLPRDAVLEESRESGGILAGVVALKADGLRDADSEQLYSVRPPDRTPVRLKAIPYYLWGNRGLNQMRVWIREC